MNVSTGNSGRRHGGTSRQGNPTRSLITGLVLLFAAAAASAQTPCWGTSSADGLADSSPISHLQVVIRTGSVSNAGTDANVMLCVGGICYDLNDPDVDDFERSTTFRQWMERSMTLGDLRRATVVLFHDNAGEGPGWNVSSVELAACVAGIRRTYRTWGNVGWLAETEYPYRLERRFQQADRQTWIREMQRSMAQSYREVDKIHRDLEANTPAKAELLAGQIQLLVNMAAFVTVFSEDLDIQGAMGAADDLQDATNNILGDALDMLASVDAWVATARYLRYDWRDFPASGIASYLTQQAAAPPAAPGSEASRSLQATYDKLNEGLANVLKRRYVVWREIDSGMLQVTTLSAVLNSISRNKTLARVGLNLSALIDDFTAQAFADRLAVLGEANRCRRQAVTWARPYSALVTVNKVRIWLDRDAGTQDPGEITLQFKVGRTSDPIEWKKSFSGHSGKEYSLNHSFWVDIPPGEPLMVKVSGSEADTFDTDPLGGFTSHHDPVLEMGRDLPALTSRSYSRRSYSGSKDFDNGADGYTLYYTVTLLEWTAAPPPLPWSDPDYKDLC